MTKVKKTVLVYLMIIRKQMFIFSSDNKFLNQKFIVTKEKIKELSLALDKANKIISTSENASHLKIAQSYCGMLYARYPFASVIYRILLEKINNSLYVTMEDGTVVSNPKFNNEEINSIFLSEDEMNNLITTQS
jgi:hypothetical protein